MTRTMIVIGLCAALFLTGCNMAALQPPPEPAETPEDNPDEDSQPPAPEEPTDAPPPTEAPTDTPPEPTETPSQELGTGCYFTAQQELTAYMLPASDAQVFGTMMASETYLAQAQTADGWVGFDPGVAQAGNVGLARMRWIYPGADGSAIVWEDPCSGTVPVVAP